MKAPAFWRRWAFWALVGAGALAVGIGLYARSNSTSLDERYRMETVARGDLVQIVSANGTLNPVKLVNVGTQVSGTVKHLYVDFNDRVTKGQVLLELDQSLLAAQVRQSEANLKNAQATLELGRANETRAKSLFAQQYVSKQELDQAVQARESAEAQLNLARAQLDKDRVNLGYTVIRSPVSGVVVSRVVDVGQTVAASFQTPTLFVIAEDLSRMQIDSNFAEADVGQIQVGQKVRFSVDAYPNRDFEGVVKQIRLNPTIQSNVVTYDVVVSVDNPEQLLLPGMTAYVNVILAERQDVLLVPNAAFRFRPPETVGSKRRPSRKRSTEAGKMKTVYVVRAGTLKSVRVAIGASDSRNTEVTGGDLNAGDQVVVGEAISAPSGGSNRVRMRFF
jgi:HlyD family secretion protein